MGNITVLGLQLGELLLIGVTTVYTVLTAVLATQAWRQRRDTARAGIAVRLRCNDGANYDVEVVNAGPGHARGVYVELSFLPNVGAEPVRVALVDEPVMLAGEVVPTYHDETAYDYIGVTARWRDGAGTSRPKPYTVDAADYRRNVIASELHVETEPQDELATKLLPLVHHAREALVWHNVRQSGDGASFDLDSWARTRAQTLAWNWQKRLAVGRALGPELVRLLRGR